MADFTLIRAQILTQTVLPWPLTIKAGSEKKKNILWQSNDLKNMSKSEDLWARASYTQMNRACVTGILSHNAQIKLSCEAI